MGNTSTTMGNTSTTMGNTSTTMGNTSTTMGNTSTTMGVTTTPEISPSTTLANINNNTTPYTIPLIGNISGNSLSGDDIVDIYEDILFYKVVDDLIKIRK
jgi:uncharacterized phosphosugar-binding protein